MKENSRQHVPCKGLFQRMALAAVTATVSLAIFHPRLACADSGITQLEYVQWLVQISGESERFNENSSATDYITWARTHGMQPKDGWKLRNKLDRDVLAQTMVQFLNLNPGVQADYAKVLAAQGISLPSGQEISRKSMASLIDNNLQSRSDLFRRPKSPQKPDRDRDKDSDKKPTDRDTDKDFSKLGPSNKSK